MGLVMNTGEGRKHMGYLVGLKPSRMFRYKIMEHEESTYVVDMLPHWYSVFWGFILNFIPSRFYQVENPSKLYYKSTWKGNGGSIGIIMGVTVFSSLVARIISQRIGGFDINIWIRHAVVWVPFIIIFGWHEYQRKKQKKELMNICKKKNDIVPEGYLGYVKGRLKKPYIKAVFLFLCGIFLYQIICVLIAVWILMSSSMNLVLYLIYPVFLILYFFMVPRATSEVLCINEIKLYKNM